MKSPGFTLIELLVLITCLGILIGAVLFGMNRARAHAFDVQALSCAHDIRNKEKLAQVQGSFLPFPQLQDTSGACAPLLATGARPVGNADPVHYAYSLRHPRGLSTYTVTDSDLYSRGIGESGAVLRADTNVLGLNLTLTADGDAVQDPGSPATPPAETALDPIKDPDNNNTLTIGLTQNATVLANHLMTSMVLNGPGSSVTLDLAPIPLGVTQAYASQTLRNLKAGTYTLAITSTDACVTINSDTHCETVIGQSSTRTFTVTLGTSGDNSFYASVTRAGQPIRLDGAGPINAQASGNVGAIEIYEVLPTDPASSAPCPGTCWLDDPTAWEARRIATRSTLTIGGASGILGYATGTGYLRFVPLPADERQPMDLSGHTIDNTTPISSYRQVPSVRVGVAAGGVITASVSTTPISSLSASN